MTILNFDQAIAQLKQSSIEFFLIAIQIDWPSFTILQLDYQGWHDVEDDEVLYVKYSGLIEDAIINVEVLKEQALNPSLHNYLFCSPTAPANNQYIAAYLEQIFAIPGQQRPQQDIDCLAKQISAKIDHINGLD